MARRWLSIQPRLDGTADIAGTLDPETAAAALAAFDTTTPIHAPDGTDDRDDHHDGDAHDSDTHDSDSGEGMSDSDIARAARRRANVDIFGDLCRLRLTRHHHPDTTTDTAATGDAAGATGAAGAAAGGGGVRGCRWCGSAPSTARPALLVVADTVTNHQPMSDPTPELLPFEPPCDRRTCTGPAPRGRPVHRRA